ncbi:hypothetical protein CLV51_104405 [Chitinophaga niastensis]|uniref:Uncharacterized protein n=1 Tax=Chitinophaga niastensis TaxID=536980 RepID=A0A2P8HHI8_CHINA|nr:hypothetical protein [Chitinophaga niastensis]PSL45698.1 hypothetical protein CLV51_104405 [Chitinophaga niastensis]
MKTTTSSEKDDNIRPAPQDMQSTLAGILESAELIALYNQDYKNESIRYQTEVIKLQVMLLELQIANMTSIYP